VIVSAIPPVLFAFTDSPGKALLVIVVYILVQQVEGRLTIAVGMPRTVKLHPAVIAVGVLVVIRACSARSPSTRAGRSGPPPA